MFFRRQRTRGRLAANLYGDLTDAERRLLKDEMARNPALQEEALHLERLLHAIPKEEAELDVDLLPLVRRRLVDSAPLVRPLALRYSFAGALAGLVVVGVLSVVVLKYGSAPTFFEQRAGDPAVSATTSSSFAGILAAADELRQRGDYTGAYNLLREEVKRSPNAPDAPTAQMRLADIAFEDLHWYQEADSAYERLIREYKEFFETSPARRTLWERHELLAEARTAGYAPLQDLDAARRDRSGNPGAYETIIARYPKTIVATQAAYEMAKLETLPGESAANAAQLAEAMKHARDKCTNPIAVAQLNVELGHIFKSQLNDAAYARACYREAAKCPEVAQLANASLNGLEREQP